MLIPHVRYMLTADVPAVTDLEASAFLNPWTKAEIRETISDRRMMPLVAEHQPAGIVGWMVYRINPLELVRIAVHPQWQRQGVGRALWLKLELKAKEKTNRIVTICPPESLVLGAGLRLACWLKSMGARATGVRRDAFADEDGIEFEYWGPECEGRSGGRRHERRIG